MKKGKKLKKINASKRKAAAYMYSAVSYSPGDLEYPATRKQADLIRTYAEKNRIDVVKSYRDEGKTRENLKKMMADINSGAAGFNILLMRDITRWGRFYTPNEAAHYESACRSAGIEVRYVDDPSKDDSVITSLFKAMKRAALEECRRELAAEAAAGRENPTGKGGKVK